jgi:hypothetical protein
LQEKYEKVSGLFWYWEFEGRLWDRIVPWF